MSQIWTRVGSILQPAPIEDITLIFLFLQNASKSTLVGMLSIQSITKSGYINSLSLIFRINSSAFYFVNRESKASKCEPGKMDLTKLDTTYAFEIPTSARVAKACLFSEDRVTQSKSITRIRLIPERASKETQ